MKFSQSVQSLSRVWLFGTWWTAAWQASLSISQSLLKLMSVESAMHPTISSSLVPFFSCLQSFPASESFPRSQFFASGGQSIWEKAKVGWFERIALKRVYYHMWNRWPVQVRCTKQGTHTWCSGTTQRDGVKREVGGEFRTGGTHGHPWLIHVDVWQKSPQYCKVIILQLK